MKKYLLLFSLVFFYGISYGYIADSQGCCSYNGGIDYIATNGGVVCSNGTVSSCQGSFRGYCTDYGTDGGTYESMYESMKSSYGSEEGFRQVSKIISDMAIASRTLEQEGKGRYAGNTLFNQKTKSEWQYRNMLCPAMFAAVKSVNNSSSSSYSNNGWTKEMKEANDAAGEHIKYGDTAANNGKIDEAISHYKSAIFYLKKTKGMDSVIKELESAIARLEQEKANAEMIKKMEEYKYNWDKLTAQYDKAIKLGNQTNYYSAIKELKDLLRNEGKIDWGDNYDLARDALARFEQAQAEYEQQVKDKEQQEQAEKDAEVENAKKALGNKAVIFEGLVPLFKQKDQATQDKVKTLLNTFKSSRDAYTKNIGIYFGHLVE